MSVRFSGKIISFLQNKRGASCFVHINKPIHTLHVVEGSLNRRNEKRTKTHILHHRINHHQGMNNDNNEKSSKIFLITGGANGIGRHLVEFFADRGHQIVFGDIDVGKGEDLAGTRQNIDFKECNVANEDSLHSILNFCCEFVSLIDVNNKIMIRMNIHIYEI